MHCVALRNVVTAWCEIMLFWRLNRLSSITVALKEALESNQFYDAIDNGILCIVDNETNNGM